MIKAKIVGTKSQVKTIISMLQENKSNISIETMVSGFLVSQAGEEDFYIECEIIG